MVKKKYSVFINWVIIIFILCVQLNYSQGSRNLQPSASNEVIQHKYNKANSPRIKKTDSYNNGHKDKYSNRFRRNNLDSENYFRIDRSKNALWDGKHWNAGDMPLKVYVKPTSSKHFKNIFADFTRYALNHWSKADSRIKFVETTAASNADIKISFVHNLMEKYDENYLGLTEYVVNEDKNILFADIQISLLKFNNKPITAGEIKATIIHEIGHALGLGHSKSEKDIMFSIISPEANSDMNFNDLSEGDKLAVRDVISLGFKNKYVNR